MTKGNPTYKNVELNVYMQENDKYNNRMVIEFVINDTHYNNRQILSKRVSDADKSKAQTKLMKWAKIIIDENV